MTATLANYRTAILALLSDDGTRFDNDTIDQGLRLAIMEYVQFSPNIQTAEITIASTGREQDLASLDNHENTLQVFYPYDSTQETHTALEAFYEYTTSGSPTLYAQGNIIPQAAEKMLVTYSAYHSIKDLDSATLTTIPDRHKTIIVSGAAGHAGIIRVSQIGESYTTQEGSRIFISEWAKKELATFRYLLRNIKSGQSGLTSLDSGAHWQLDRWDK